MMLVSGFILGMALVAFSFSDFWYLSIALIAFVGLGQTAGMTLANTLIQHYVEDEYRGRVMSILLMQFSLMSFSTFIAGLLSEIMGIQWAIGGLAMILILISLITVALVPRIRKLD